MEDLYKFRYDCFKSAHNIDSILTCWKSHLLNCQNTNYSFSNFKVKSDDGNFLFHKIKNKKNDKEISDLLSEYLMKSEKRKIFLFGGSCSGKSTLWQKFFPQMYFKQDLLSFIELIFNLEPISRMIDVNRIFNKTLFTYHLKKEVIDVIKAIDNISEEGYKIDQFPELAHYFTTLDENTIKGIPGSEGIGFFVSSNIGNTIKRFQIKYNLELMEAKRIVLENCERYENFADNSNMDIIKIDYNF